MDVRVGRNAGPAELEAQAIIYGELLHVCLAARNCPAFVTWGVSDRDSRIRRVPKETWEQPLLFDDQFRPKPAYHALAAALSAR
jgi:endo-1,4-beta-xylanase